MADHGFIVRSDKPERLFVKVYHDFLDSKILDRNEKMVFILLKRYLDFRFDESGISGKVYPTMETLACQCGMTRGAVARTIKSLEAKKLISIEKTEGYNKPNIYTLHDYAETWKADSVSEAARITSEIAELKIVEELRAKGWTCTKEKELASEPVKAHEQAPNNDLYDKNNTNVYAGSCQAVERYPIEEIYELYSYENMIADNKDRKADIDIVMTILHETLNTRKPKIWISGEELSAKDVMSKLLALDSECIMYAINQYNAQTNPIKNQKAYMLTILYNAKEQYHLYLNNVYAQSQVKE
jgi:DNA-binding MarR family transcriptional regulator